jgi:hypothetical protein
MDNIIEPDDSFDFSKLSLAHPVSIAGSAYFTKILFEGNPLYIQTPKSSTKQGFFKAPGKKIFCDLMFENTEGKFIHWLESLETRCQELIHEKSSDWFQNSLDLSDIESAFNSPMKSFKSGKYYLVRTNVKINSLTNNPLIKIYNESETPLSLEDITSESNIISILEVQGIKFTTRNFQIEIEHKQAMLLNKDILYESCLIKKKIHGGIQPLQEKQNLELQLSNPVSPSSLDEKEIEQMSDSILEEINTEIIEATKNEQVKNTIQSGELEEYSIQPNLELELHLNEDNNENDSEDEREHEDKYVDENSTNSNKNDNNNNNDNNDNNDNEKNKPLLDTRKNSSETNEDLEEVNFGLDLENNLETLTLKKPNEVYYEMYKQAREKAKNAKKEALMAFLEAKNIKQTYMLDDIDSSDESNFSDEEEFETENLY